MGSPRALVRRAAKRFPHWRFAFVSASLVGTMVLAAGGAVEAAGAAARPQVAREVAAAVAARLPGLRREDEPAVAHVVISGEPVTLTFARQLAPAGGTAAVLGTTTSRSVALAVVAGRAHLRVPLLPPSFPGRSARWW